MHLSGYTIVGTSRSSVVMLLKGKLSFSSTQTSCQDSLTKSCLFSTPNVFHRFFSPSTSGSTTSVTQLLEKEKNVTQAAKAACSPWRNVCACRLPEKHPHSHLPRWSSDDWVTRYCWAPREARAPCARGGSIAAAARLSFPFENWTYIVRNGCVWQSKSHPEPRQV